jgi:hypothetical protein
MPVAKTYAKMTIEGEPFQENNRMYVYVSAPKGLKKVRWYSDAEYRRMYPDAVILDTTMNFDARHAFGFGEEGYITLYKGHKVEEWAENDRTNIWYNLDFLYYTPGRLGRPNLIEGIEPIVLKWEDVAAEGNMMRPHEEVQKIVAALLYEESVSKYQGQVNEWLQKEVTVRAKKSDDGRFGTKHMYNLVDAEGNTYVWETGAKDYALDQTVSLKMKVREHKKIKDEQVTVVWYCKEI